MWNSERRANRGSLIPLLSDPTNCVIVTRNEDIGEAFPSIQRKFSRREKFPPFGGLRISFANVYDGSSSSTSSGWGKGGDLSNKGGDKHSKRDFSGIKRRRRSFVSKRRLQVVPQTEEMFVAAVYPVRYIFRLNHPPPPSAAFLSRVARF